MTTIALMAVAWVLLQLVPKKQRLVVEIAVIYWMIYDATETWKILLGLITLIVLSVALVEEIENAKNLHGGGK